jgi:hypothetical protein
LICDLRAVSAQLSAFSLYVLANRQLKKESRPSAEKKLTADGSVLTASKSKI